ncbi:MAG: carbon storage regulator [Myxococcales bacterium]|nr:carbon storage regulator [Myxococcales bacterium]
MLILQRRVGQRIVVSGGVEITVTAVTKRGVRLAVSAPKGIAVLRGEVHDAIALANAQAAQSIEVDIDDVSAADLTTAVE